MIYIVDEPVTKPETPNIRLHPFEVRSLGVAPFRCTGMTERAIRYPDGTSQAAGTCDYCGTGIRYCFHITDALGKQFIVGSDCVLKTGTSTNTGQGLIAEVRKLQLDAAREKRRVSRQARWEKFTTRVRAAREALQANPVLFTDRPHPSDYYAKQGLTYRDYCDYMLRTGNMTTGTAIVREIERATTTKPEE